MKLPPLPSLATIALGVSASFVAGHTAFAQSTGFNQTGSGPFDYNSASNWVGGLINGVWGSDLTLSASQAVTFGGNATVGATNGVSFSFNFNSATGPFGVTLRSDGTANRTLTLGGDIYLNTTQAGPNPTVTFGSTAANNNLGVDLGSATRLINVGGNSGNRAISFKNAISGSGVGITKMGVGTLTLEAANTYTGATTIIGANASGGNGPIVLAGAGRSANSDFILNSQGQLSINHAGNGNASLTRGKSLTINSGLLGLSGSPTPNATRDIFTDGITVNGSAVITLSPGTGKSFELNAGSFTQNAGATTLFRGVGLGVNAIGTANGSNVTFTTAPALVGSGAAGGSSVGIIAGAYGDTTSAGNGSGLVTYDAARGVRLLDVASEYTGTLADGSGNVRLSGVSGAASVTTFALDGSATVQSLSLVTSGAAGNAGVIVAGTEALGIASGTIFANQPVTGTPTAADAIVISKALAFGSVEAKVLVGSTSGAANGITVAPLEISGVISGDAGLTKAGAGNLHLAGSASNTYGGVTTMNGGNLYLAKSGGAVAIPGNLVVNGGNVLQAGGNQIADTAHVTVNGGTMRMAASTGNSTGVNETFASLTVNGGNFAAGSANQAGANATLVVTGAVVVNGGTYNQTAGYLQEIGSLTMNGGTSVIGASTSGGTQPTRMRVSGDLIINNVASAAQTAGGGAYVPITLNAGGTGAAGAQLILQGDVRFAGNATNANTTLIAAGAGTNLGAIQLDGPRTFEVGDGAAAIDLTVNPIIANRSTGGVVVGGIVKTGAGTLALGGANTYTGATTVDAGTLALVGSGSINAASALSVASGARFDASALASYTLSSAAGTTLGVGATGAGLIKAASLDFNGASLTFDFGSVSTLAESYQVFDFVGLAGSGFGGVAATGASISGAFSALGSGVWSLDSGQYTLTFTESTGLLTASSIIPEPAAVAFLAGLAGLGCVVLRRRRRAS